MVNSRVWATWLKERSVSTDTRKIRAGALFFALKGENFDGNRFAARALEAGASVAVVDDSSVVVDDRYILVGDVLKELQDLAHAWRQTFSFPLIALTGSNGKTTTKELILAVLSTEKKVMGTVGNLNNHIGVPLTLLSFPPDLDLGVVEMGANKPKDIEELVQIARPEFGLITNVGYAHLEGMGGIEGVARTKGEMFDFLRENGGEAWINFGDVRVAELGKDFAPSFSYGSPDADAECVFWQEGPEGATCELRLPGHSPLTLHTLLTGRHNAENVLVAALCGWRMGISLAGIQSGIEGYLPAMNRTQLVHLPGLTVLMDAYNANATSMKASITGAMAQPRGRVAFVLGDMFELGEAASAMHRMIGEEVGKLKPELLVAIGPNMREASAAASNAGVRTVWFEDVMSAKGEIRFLMQGIDFMVLKGSRGMALERLMPELGWNEGNGH